MPNNSHIFERKYLGSWLGRLSEQVPYAAHSHLSKYSLFFIFGPFFLPSLQDTVSSDIEFYFMAFYRTVSGFLILLFRSSRDSLF
jgi:hypothetical protein